jgi:hypothetical protein
MMEEHPEDVENIRRPQVLAEFMYLLLTGSHIPSLYMVGAEGVPELG